MPKRVEDWEEDRVIELCPKQCVERETEGETDISNTSQRKYVKEFIRESEKMGTDEAAELGAPPVAWGAQAAPGDLPIMGQGNH